MDGPVYASYTEAYAASKAEGSGHGYAGSRASTEQYRAGNRESQLRASVNKLPIGSSLPAKTVSVVHRPYKPSVKNSENLDVQHERDSQAFEKRAGMYRRLASQPYHHNKPIGSVLTLWEQGHIVDRGRSKAGEAQRQSSYGIVNPLTLAQVLPGTNAEKPERPISAPHQRSYAQIHARPASPSLEHKRVQAARGQYNPLTHTYTQEPDSKYVDRKEREFARSTGTNNGLRKQSGDSFAFDPISGAYTARPVSAQRPTRSPAPQARHHQEDTACAPISPAPPTIATTEAPSTPVQASVSAVLLPTPAEAPWSAPAHIVPAAGSVPQRAGSAARERSGRSPVMCGKSWGTYDPITCVWKVPPGDSKFSDPDALVDKQAGVSGQSMGRSPQQHGVYNPILNTWTVLPADPKKAGGLSFAPATLFTRPTAATIRM